MNNVIQFQRTKGRGKANATTLVEAFGLAAIAIASWWHLCDRIQFRHFGFADHPWPPEPKVRFQGSDYPVSTILDMAEAMQGELPPILRAIVVDIEMWTDEEPDLTSRTFSDAVQELRGILEACERPFGSDGAHA